jgi:HK97 family phage prohead protease
MVENRATPDELATGDFVAWLVETESYAGQVVSVDGATTIVRIWDEDDECDCCEDCWEQGDLDVVVATEAIQPIEPLMICDCEAMAMPLAGSTVIPTRDKWIRAAWKIKAKLEGHEERALGKGEIRTNHIELRAEGDGRTFTGYAAVFNEPSLPLPFTEIVQPGAFKRSLQSRNRMMLLWNHDTSNPLASTRNGSLQMVEDARGLKVTATLPDTTLGRDIAELVRTGVVDAMSFGFSVKRDSWSADGNTRYLEDVSLYEVSLVSTPAYEQTSGTVSVRSTDGLSADALAVALQKLEEGEELDASQSEMMKDVIERLSGKVEEPEGDVTALYKKKLVLAEMGN